MAAATMQHAAAHYLAHEGAAGCEHSVQTCIAGHLQVNSKCIAWHAQALCNTHRQNMQHAAVTLVGPMLFSLHCRHWMPRPRQYKLFTSYTGRPSACLLTLLIRPQLPSLQALDAKAKAVACASSRSCVTAYPTRQQYGLIWVWPSAGPAAAAQAGERQLASTCIYTHIYVLSGRL